MKYLSVETMKKDVPYAQPKPGFDLGKMVKDREVNGRTVYEFIGTDNFGPQWYERQRFEVDAGRLRVPTIYEPIYDIIVDSNLPETIRVYNWGQGGFALEEIFEGGEVKFGHITTAEAMVTQRQFGVALEYSKRLVMFNQMWQISRIERIVGEAYNALLNHLHLYPIISYNYTGDQVTSAVTSGSTLTEDWFLTLEAAVLAGMLDTENPRNGPYVLLTHPAHQFMLERVFNRVPQQGFALDSRALSGIQSVIGYNGWTGTRGKLTVTYPGITPGEGFLINLGYKSDDFISMVKQPLEAARGNPDVSRFILEQVVWDVFIGIYSNPVRAVQKVIFPTGEE